MTEHKMTAKERLKIHEPNEIAQRNLDEWNEVTGFVEKETQYYWEILSVMEDAMKEFALQVATEAIKEESAWLHNGREGLGYYENRILKNIKKRLNDE